MLNATIVRSSRLFGVSAQSYVDKLRRRATGLAPDFEQLGLQISALTAAAYVSSDRSFAAEPVRLVREWYVASSPPELRMQNMYFSI